MFRIACVIYAYAIVQMTALDLPAQEIQEGFEMIQLAFHPPSEQEVEELREMVYELDLEQSLLERYALRCEGFLMNRYQPEYFVFIHAVDKEKKATRHMVRREFTDKYDPRLKFSIEGPEGYSDSRKAGPSPHPITNDKLRIGPKVYLTNLEAHGIDKEKIKFTGADRYFDPITGAFLPFTSFFQGNFSKVQRVSKNFS